MVVYADAPRLDSLLHLAEENLEVLLLNFTLSLLNYCYEINRERDKQQGMLTDWLIPDLVTDLQQWKLLTSILVFYVIDGRHQIGTSK